MKHCNLHRSRRTFLGFLAAIYLCIMIAIYLPVTSMQSAGSDVTDNDAVTDVRQLTITTMSPSTLSSSSSPSRSTTFPTILSIPATLTFRRWLSTEVRHCNNSLTFYANQLARLRDVIVDRRFCVAAAKGGENIDSVINQSEMAEFYLNVAGCFQLSSCSAIEQFVQHRYFFNYNYLNDWLQRLRTRDVDVTDVQTIETSFTIATVREEYANLYYCIQDWYVTFLMMSFFGKAPEETNILLVDAHPRGLLDSSWNTLFNSSRQLSALNPRRTQFKDLVWSINGHSSQLKSPYSYRTDPPLVNEFHRFVLSRHGVPDPDVDRRLDCSNVSVLFIWRHDYVAHPRNPAGTVQRKIANEEELISSLSTRRRNLRVRGVQIDKYSMTDQLKMAAESDILVGMHGAGLSHTLFLPRHGALVELVSLSSDYENTHFADLAIWRGLAYYRWVNTDPRNEVGPQLTRLPVDAIDQLLQSVVTEMCSTNRRPRINAFTYHEQLIQQKVYNMNGYNIRRN
jgi:hypothetical protein